MKNLNLILEQVSNHFGSQSALAKKLNVSSGAITNWIARGHIPATRAIQIQKITNNLFNAVDITSGNKPNEIDNHNSECQQCRQRVGKHRQAS